MMSSDESEMIEAFAEMFEINIDRVRALVKEAKTPQVKWGSKQAKELAENSGVDVSSIQPTGKNNSIVLKDIHEIMGKKPRSASMKSSPSAFASKIAKDLAENSGVDVSSIKPTGKNNSIVLKDIYIVLENIPGGTKPKSASTKSSPSAFASKIAKDLAEKHGIKADQITVRGSKDGKKIVKSDIMKYLNEKNTKNNEPSDEETPVQDESSESEDEQHSEDEQQSDDEN